MSKTEHITQVIQQLVAFDDSGPFPGLVQNLTGVATSLAANRGYVAVVSGGQLVVYQSFGLYLVGSISAGPATGWNPYSVVIDQNSNMAYVTSLSAPTIAGQVNAVNLDTLSVIGSAAPVGNGPFNTRPSWDGSYLFVANQNDGPPGTVSVLSAGTSGVSLLRTVTVGTKPGPLAIHP